MEVGPSSNAARSLNAISTAPWDWDSPPAAKLAVVAS